MVVEVGTGCEIRGSRGWDRSRGTGESRESVEAEVVDR